MLLAYVRRAIYLYDISNNFRQSVYGMVQPDASADSQPTGIEKILVQLFRFFLIKKVLK